MITEEAFDDIKLFVSHLGNVDFERTKDIISADVLFWFGEEIFEASGEPKEENGAFFAEKALCEKIIKKYLNLMVK